MYSYETTADIKARMRPLLDKQKRHERLSVAEARQLSEDSKILTDRIIEQSQDAKTEYLANEAPAEEARQAYFEQRAAVAEQVRNAVGRGVVPGISGLWWASKPLCPEIMMSSRGAHAQRPVSLVSGGRFSRAVVRLLVC